MEHFFVSPGGTLLERWAKAFPQAHVVTAAAELPPLDAGQGQQIIWLDIDSLSPAERFDEVRRVVATGQVAVAMSATPSETEAYHMLNNGALGYCHLMAAPEQLREIALVVEHGGIWMPPELTQRLLKLSVRIMPQEVPEEHELDQLTAREVMVAQEVARGASNREISERLEITERTVKAHLSSIFEKLEVRDRVQLALEMNRVPVNTTIN